MPVHTRWLSSKINECNCAFFNSQLLCSVPLDHRDSLLASCASSGFNFVGAEGASNITSGPLMALGSQVCLINEVSSCLLSFASQAKFRRLTLADLSRFSLYIISFGANCLKSLSEVSFCQLIFVRVHGSSVALIHINASAMRARCSTRLWNACPSSMSRYFG